MKKHILFISNGHGEDTDSAHTIIALREADPDIEFAALPLVGSGNSYREIDVPIIAPTLVLPSGGFTYVQRSKLLGDIRAGLLGSTIKQWRAMRREAPKADLIFATGDSFAQTFAHFSRKPFIAFIAPLSAHYEGTLNLDFLLNYYFHRPLCKTVIARDTLTTDDLRRQGYPRISYGGMPSIDYLGPTGLDLSIPKGAAVIGLLPGSRIPEAERNFRLQLRFAEKVARRNATRKAARTIVFRAALVPLLMASRARLAADEGWISGDAGILTKQLENGIKAEIRCYDNAFADILNFSTLVIGMAGQAADQALALGTPSLLFAGEGPQFSYPFAEAQNRIHGGMSVLVGDKAANEEILEEAAGRLIELVDDKQFLERAAKGGPLHFGSKGSSKRIVDVTLPILAEAVAGRR